MHLVLLSGLLSNETLWKHQKHLEDIASIQIFSSFQDSGEKMVQTILDQAPDKFALAGHSMGGWLALEIMRVAPKRVLKLCLLNTTAREDSEEKRERRRKMLKGDFAREVKEIVNHLVYNRGVKPIVERMFLDVGPDAFINQEKAMLKRGESESILSAIRAPTLVIHAAKDQNFTLEEHEELVEKIRGSKLAIIEDSGHMSPIEMPQAVTALLRFWLQYF